MGVTSAYFIATEDQIAALTLDDYPFDKLFISIEAGKASITELAHLQVILCGTSFDEAIDDQRMVKDFGGDGPWIFAFPEKLMPVLVHASWVKLKETADAWRIETARPAYRWDLEATFDFLCRLSAFIRRAIALKKPIFVCTSL